jgi:hypothetical protein
MSEQLTPEKIGAATAVTPIAIVVHPPKQKEKVFRETTSKLEESLPEDMIRKLMNLRHKLAGKEKKDA